MDLSGLLLRDGAIVTATGRVLVIDGVVWFELPLPEVAIYPRPTPTLGPFAVRAHGIDLDRLDNPEQHPGVLKGWTTVTGLWREGELHVRTQSSWQQPGLNRAGTWTTPPCPPPPGGWPDRSQGGRLTPPPRDSWAALTITQVTQFQPGPAQAVLVIAAEHPELVEQTDASVCVVRSHYTKQQIDEATDRLRAEQASRRWPISMTGHTASEDGQPRVNAQLAWVVPELVEWARTVPDGLLDLDVWLTPAEH